MHSYTSIKPRWARFDQYTCSFLVCVCAVCLPASLIMHVPFSELHVLTLQHEFELSTFPSIRSNVMLVPYVDSCFIVIRQSFFPFFSSRVN